MAIEAVEKAIRDIPDFPKPGIIFKDITPVLGSPALFAEVVDALCAPYADSPPDRVVAIESRGFIFGAAMAYKLGCGLVPVRKAGKLPYETNSASYELEYGEATLEIHIDALEKGERVVVVDDLLATGGTAAAAAGLAKGLGAEVVGVDFVLELTFLKGRERLAEYPVRALIAVD